MIVNETKIKLGFEPEPSRSKPRAVAGMEVSRELLQQLGHDYLPLTAWKTGVKGPFTVYGHKPVSFLDPGSV